MEDLKKFIATTIREFLNESSTNTNNLKYWMDFVLKEIEFINPTERKNSKKENINMMKVSFSKTDKETHNILKEKMNKLKEHLVENGIMISFFINYAEIEIFFKKLYVKTEPTKYVYHSSPVENRESILKNGLVLKSSDESKDWKFGLQFAYPKAIFATKINKNGIINPWMGDVYDIWRIDTDALGNEWFVDLNYVGEKDNNHIMTFKPISPKYLELARKGIKK